LHCAPLLQALRRLNESPSKKEGKSACLNVSRLGLSASMKALPKKKGNTRERTRNGPPLDDSMKVPAQGGEM